MIKVLRLAGAYGPGITAGKEKNMGKQYGKGFDSGFASKIDYEEGFRESDATRWARANNQKGLFDFSKSMNQASDVTNRGLSHEGAQQSLEESSPEKLGMHVPLEDALREAEVSMDELHDGLSGKTFEDEFEQMSAEGLMESNTKLADFDTGKRDPGGPRFSGEVASRLALEDMSAEQLAELGLEPGTFAPLESDDGFGL